MQFLIYFLALISCSLLVFIYNTRKNMSQNGKIREAPEPSGALPIIGHLHLLRGKTPLARILGNMSEKYGPIYLLRLGKRRELVVSSWEMMKECFTVNDKNFSRRPSSAFSTYMGFDGASFAVSPYGRYWSFIRKIVNLHLFGNQTLQKLRYVWNSEANYLVKDLYSICQKNGHPMSKVNLSKFFELGMCNIPVRIVSGKRLSSNEENIKDLHVKEAIKKGLDCSGLFVVSNLIPNLQWMDIGGCLKSIQQSAKELDGIVGTWLEEHLQKGRRSSCDANKETDFIHVMHSTLTEDDANMFGYTRDVIIRATSVVLLLAGTDTTKETLNWSVSLLLNNPDILRAAQEELDVHVGKHRWVEESDINNLVYLQAIVKETLRLYPPGPLAGPHEAIADCHVGGYYVPKGTYLVINLWQLHHDPRVWSNPYEFRPKRFLKKHSDDNYHDQNFKYMPFGSGRRMCPANTLALQVVHLTLARLLQGFEFSLSMGERIDMSEGLGFSLFKANPLEVLLTPRLGPELYENL